MTWYMLAAEEFQDSIEGIAAVCCMYEDFRGYFVPFRNKSDSLLLAVFTEKGRRDYTWPEFMKTFKGTYEAFSFDRIAHYAPARGSRVYFISDGESIKIGVSVNPQERLLALQTGHARQLSILCTIPGGADEEFHMHAKFRHHRIRGEWFNDCQEIRDFVSAANDNTTNAAAA